MPCTSMIRSIPALNYERNPNAPHNTQQLVLAVDPFGNITESASIGYPRRNVSPADPATGAPNLSEQSHRWATYTQSRFSKQSHRSRGRHPRDADSTLRIHPRQLPTERHSHPRPHLLPRTTRPHQPPLPTKAPLLRWLQPPNPHQGVRVISSDTRWRPLMLENGADIRHIQEMLGHAALSTTQIYTQVSIRRLEAVHAVTRPASRELRPLKETGPGEPPLSDDELRQRGRRSGRPGAARFRRGAGHAGQRGVSRTTHVEGRFPPAPAGCGAARARAPGHSKATRRLAELAAGARLRAVPLTAIWGGNSPTGCGVARARSDRRRWMVRCRTHD